MTARELLIAARALEDDMVPRESGCLCQWEIGDSHCPVHPCEGCTFCSEIRKQFLADKADRASPPVDVITRAELVEALGSMSHERSDAETFTRAEIAQALWEKKRQVGERGYSEWHEMGPLRVIETLIVQINRGEILPRKARS